MKQGINLGRLPSRPSLPLVALFALSSAAALVLAGLYLRARHDVLSIAREVAGMEDILADSPRPSEDEARFVSSRLGLALDSGALAIVPPTAILHLVDSGLPEGVLLEGLSFSARPRQTLTLDASAYGGDRVTELERRLAGSPLVEGTSLLEERRLPDGRLAVRLRVDLKWE